MFRTVVIKNASKLQYIQGYLVVYDGEFERRVFISELSAIIIESNRTLITAPLIVELIKRSIAVIFCDEKHNPIGTLNGLTNHYANSGNLYKQIEWDEKFKGELWQNVVKLKINLQKQALIILCKGKYDLLEKYEKDVQIHDVTNREALAAKVYFFSLFGNEFNRNEESVINSLLDYGYSIILSAFNREIVASGYLTQFGIFHKGKTNPFNLSSDFMEPFRSVVDIVVNVSINDNNPLERIRKILTYKILINNEDRYIDDAIRVFVNQMINNLNEKTMNIPVITLKGLETYSSESSYENNNNV